jgi:hypothetical protein
MNITTDNSKVYITLETVDEVLAAAVEVRVPAQEGYEAIAAIAPAHGVIFAANAIRLLVERDENLAITGVSLSCQENIPLTISSAGGVKFVGDVDFSDANVTGLEVN